MNKQFYLLLIVLVIISSQSANAQLFIDPGAKIQQDNKQQRERQQLPSTPLIRKNDQPLKTSEQESKGPCIEINTINIRTWGFNKNIKAAKEIKSKYLRKKCLNKYLLASLLKDLSKAYNDAGYFQAQAYIKEQDLSTGILEIQIVPVKLEAIKINDSENSYKALKFFNIPTRKGDIIEFSDLETGIDALNKLKSIDARLKLAPGNKPNTSQILIDLKEKDRLRGYIGFNNQGQDFTGIYRLAPSIEIDNLLRMGDTWTISYNGNADTDALIIGAQIPLWPTWTLNASYVYSDFLANFHSGPVGASPIIDFYGDYKGADLGIIKQIYRNKGFQAFLGGGLRYKESQREINGAQLANQSTRALYLNTTIANKYKTGQFNAGGTFDWGTPFFNATETPSNGRDDIADGKFIKFSTFFNLYQQLPLNIGLFSSSINAQWSPDAMFGVEHLILGGLYSIRGYEEGSFSAENGFQNRNEITLYWPEYNRYKTMNFLQKHIQPILFFDHGWAVFPYNTNNQQRYIASTGIGSRINFSLFTAELMFGIPILEPSGAEINHKGRLHFNIRLKPF